MVSGTPMFSQMLVLVKSSTKQLITGQSYTVIVF